MSHLFLWSFANLRLLRISPWNSYNRRSTSPDQFVLNLPISFSMDFFSSYTLSPSEIKHLKTICLSRHHNNLRPSRQDFKTCFGPAQLVVRARKGTLCWKGRIHDPTRMATASCRKQQAGMQGFRGGSTDLIRLGLASSEEPKQANSICHEYESGNQCLVSLNVGSFRPKFCLPMKRCIVISLRAV